MNRRKLIAAGSALIGAGTSAGPVAAAVETAWPSALLTPRVRVISDNDYGGDPDGLVQLAHLLLSRTVDIRGVIGSHLRVGDPFDASPNTADKAATAARRIVDLTGRTGVSVIAGTNAGLEDRHTPVAQHMTAACDKHHCFARYLRALQRMGHADVARNLDPRHRRNL